jgi:hypothetical protein
MAGRPPHQRLAKLILSQSKPPATVAVITRSEMNLAPDDSVRVACRTLGFDQEIIVSTHGVELSDRPLAAVGGTRLQQNADPPDISAVGAYRSFTTSPEQAIRTVDIPSLPTPATADGNGHRLRAFV